MNSVFTLISLNLVDIDVIIDTEFRPTWTELSVFGRQPVSLKETLNLDCEEGNGKPQLS